MVTIKINASEAQIKKLLQGKTVQLKHSQLGHGVSIDVHPENFKKIQNGMKKSSGARLTLSDHELSGNGIFGKKADKFMEKHGIKKAVYAAGRELKPLAHELINTAGKAVDAYVPGLGSMGASMASNYIDHPDEKHETDHAALGAQMGAKAAEMLSAKMAAQSGGKICRTCGQHGGRLGRFRPISQQLISGGAVNPYMPTSLSGGAIRGKPAIHLRNDQSNFITANSPAFFPIQPRTVKEFQTGGSFRN